MQIIRRCFRPINRCLVIYQISVDIMLHDEPRRIKPVFMSAYSLRPPLLENEDGRIQELTSNRKSDFPLHAVLRPSSFHTSAL